MCQTGAVVTLCLAGQDTVFVSLPIYVCRIRDTCHSGYETATDRVELSCPLQGHLVRNGPAGKSQAQCVRPQRAVPPLTQSMPAMPALAWANSLPSKPWNAPVRGLKTCKSPVVRGPPPMTSRPSGVTSMPSIQSS